MVRQLEEYDPPLSPRDEAELDTDPAYSGRWAAPAPSYSHPPPIRSAPVCGDRRKCLGFDEADEDSQWWWICARTPRHDDDHVHSDPTGKIRARWPQRASSPRHRVVAPRAPTCPKCGAELEWANLALRCPDGHGVFA